MRTYKDYVCVAGHSASKEVYFKSKYEKFKFDIITKREAKEKPIKLIGYISNKKTIPKMHQEKVGNLRCDNLLDEDGEPIIYAIYSKKPALHLIKGYQNVGGDKYVAVTKMFPWIAAIVALLIACGLVYFLLNPTPDSLKKIIGSEKVIMQEDSDGTHTYLDSFNKETVTEKNPIFYFYNPEYNKKAFCQRFAVYEGDKLVYETPEDTYIAPEKYDDGFNARKKLSTGKHTLKVVVYSYQIDTFEEDTSGSFSVELTVK